MPLEVGDALDSMIEAVEDVVDRDTAIALFDVLAQRRCVPRLERWLAASGQLYESGMWLYQYHKPVNALARSAQTSSSGQQVVSIEPPYLGERPSVGGGFEAYRTLWVWR